VPERLGAYSFRSAEAADASRVAELVDAACGHYLERIGMLPGPMTADYAEVIRNRQVTVAERDGAIVGVIVLTVTDEGFLVDNVAVHPSHRGTGLGRALLKFAEAEARRAGFDSIYLYTHEQMTENLALYARIGYVEYDRRSKARSRLSTCPSTLDELALGPLGPPPGRARPWVATPRPATGRCPLTAGSSAPSRPSSSWPGTCAPTR
jgi:ribosomal protein S18 acetylase RimI-like enzyme